MMGLGKLQLHAKYEVASFCHCRNIKGNPKILWGYPIQQPRPLFLVGVILRLALANPSCKPNLKSLASALAKILKKTPNFRELPRTSPRPLFFLMGFYDGPWQLPAASQFWSRYLQPLQKY